MDRQVGQQTNKLEGGKEQEEEKGKEEEEGKENAFEIS